MEFCAEMILKMIDVAEEAFNNGNSKPDEDCTLYDVGYSDGLDIARKIVRTLANK